MSDWSCVCMYILCMPGIRFRDQKRTSDSLELELQTVVSSQVGAENWTQDLWKNSQWFLSADPSLQRSSKWAIFLSVRKLMLPTHLSGRLFAFEDLHLKCMCIHACMHVCIHIKVPLTEVPAGLPAFCVHGWHGRVSYLASETLGEFSPPAFHSLLSREWGEQKSPEHSAHREE